MNPASTIVYRIDAEDRLVHVNEAWCDFARNNDGAAVTPANVLGTSLWQHITEPTVHDIYVRLVKRARGGHPTAFDYRCDAPGWRREYRMTIAGQPDGSVEFASRLLSQTPRPVIRLLDAQQPRDRRLVRVCSWCHCISAGGDRWLQLEAGVNELKLMAGDTLPRLTHGICPACAWHHFQMYPADLPQPSLS